MAGCWRIETRRLWGCESMANVSASGPLRSFSDDPRAFEDERGRTDPLDWPDLDGLVDCPADVLRARVDRVGRWFHAIDLGRGVITPGAYDPASKLHRFGIPEDLGGRRVLDVGAWDGFFSFECARRGAEVTSLDIWKPGHNATSEGYAVARAALGLHTEALRGSVFELDPGTHGVYDLVLFLGVLYHLEDPLGAIRRLHDVTGDRLIIETECDLAFCRRPAAAFYPTTELAGDATNWFAPNARALLGMLTSAGFREATVFWSMPLWMRAGRAMHRSRRFGESLFTGLSRGRLVAHASR